MKRLFRLHSSILAGAMILATVLFTGTSVQAEDPETIVIIANKSLPDGEISVGELRALFLKKKGSYKGKKVVPINAKDGTILRTLFLDKILEMTPDEEKSYWEEEKIKTSVAEPAEFRNTLKAVFSVKGAIGYCKKSDYKEGVVKKLGEI